MKKFILGSLALFTLLQADTLYTQQYFNSSEVIKPTIDTKISNYVNLESIKDKKAIQFSPLYFKDGELTDKSQENLKNIIDKIVTSGSSNYTITLVGHSSDYIDPDETVKLNAWSTFWHNIGNTSQLTKAQSATIVNNHLLEVYKILKDNDINTRLIYTENRLGKDRLSSEAISQGRMINNRVDIALYGVN